MVLVIRIAAHSMVGFAIVLAMAGIVGIGFAERQGGDLLGAAAIALFGAGALRLAIGGRPAAWTRTTVLIGCVVVWFLLAGLLAAALAVTTSLRGADAVFEATSALTTTAATLLPDPDRLPRSIVLLLALFSWYGGALTLATAAVLLIPTGVGGVPDRGAPAAARQSADFEGAYTDFVRGLLPVYAALGLGGTLLLALMGLPIFDAICLAASTLSTGGYLPRTAGLAAYDSAAVQTLLGVFMLIGATSIVWIGSIATGHWARALRPGENGIFLVIVAFFAAGLALGAAGRGAAKPIVDGFFTAASLLSTTGYQRRAGDIAAIPITIVALAIFVGGTTVSTSGGLKLYRVTGMLTQSARELRRLLYPHGIRPARIGGEPYSIQSMKALWTSFSVWMIAFAFLLAIVGFDHREFAGAFVAALSALSNAGPVFPAQATAGDAAWTWSAFAPATKLVLAIAMIAGRVEILVLLVLFNLAVWRR